MTINYNELFSFLYSTRIPESLKDEVINIIELPVQESEIEQPFYIHECVNFLDNLAYSNMSEELTNELIDNVFEGCSEEFMNDILEAYIQVKAYEYITEGVAPVGLSGIKRETEARKQAEDAAERQKYERALKSQERKQAIGKAVNDFKTKATEIGGKAKEGIKAAVGKVKDWYKKTTQDRPIGLAKMTGYKAQNRPAEQPKVETPKPEVKSETKPVEQPKVEIKPEPAKEEVKTKPSKPKKVSKKVAAEVSKPKEEVETTAAPEPKIEASKSKLESPKPKKSRGIKIVDKVAKKKEEKQEPVKPTEEIKVETPKPVEQPRVEPTKPKRSSKKVASEIVDPDKVTVDDIEKGKMTGKSKSEKAQQLAVNRDKQDQVKYHQKAIKDYDMEIAAAEGKPAMMAKLGEIRQKREEHIKALEKLQAKV